MQKITPCLWFESEAEEAAKFYVAVFENSRILNVSRYGEGAPMPAGTVLAVDFVLDGAQFQAINGRSAVGFTEAVSFSFDAGTQPEIDRLWAALTADGGEPGRCGWLRDRFGVSWQIVPARLATMLNDEDAERTGRVMQAMLAMTKIELAELEAAYGSAASSGAASRE